MPSALQKRKCCSATSAAQLSGNGSATSVFACGMLQGWGLEGWGLGLADAFGLLEISGFSGPQGGQGQHKPNRSRVATVIVGAPRPASALASPELLRDSALDTESLL